MISPSSFQGTIMKKLIRLTTADISLDGFLKGQLKYLNQYYEVVGVAADTGVLKNVAVREGIRVIDLPMHREIALGSDIKSLVNLYKLFRNEKPYILHANTPKGSLLAMMAGMMARIPHRIYTVTGLRYQGATGLFRFILKCMERITCLCATNVIPEGNGVLHCLKKDNITNKPLRIIHNGNINGVDTAFFSPELFPENDKSDSKFTFVFVGRIVKDKGIHELVECMRQLDCKLILVGAFEDGDPVSDEAKQFLLNSPKVKFVGWQTDIRPFLAEADALVFPSYREGFPNVPMQAGSMGKACIVTNINGCNEIIKDGLNGKIIEPRNATALLNTMKWFMNHPEEVKRMAGNARKMIQDRYEQKDVWQGLLNYYHAL